MTRIMVLFNDFGGRRWLMIVAVALGCHLNKIAADMFLILDPFYLHSNIAWYV
jgi:hypothetical protein